MHVYKFKALDNFHQVVDILLNERIYCPTPSELNDPLEGVLGVSGPALDEGMSPDDKLEATASFWMSAEAELNQYRVCSFSRIPDNPLMWAYYGKGHSGICIELDLLEHATKIIPIQYVRDLSVINRASAHNRLSHKLKQWQHENELRLIFSPEYRQKFIKAKIISIIVGTRLPEQFYSPLFELCKIKKYNIQFTSFNTLGEATRFSINMQKNT